MAVTDFDRKAITRQEDLNALEANTKRWEEAYARGDQKEMDLAAKNAAYIRNAYGYYTTTDGTGAKYYSNGGRFNPTYITGASGVTKGQVNAYDNAPNVTFNDSLYEKNNSTASVKRPTAAPAVTTKSHVNRVAPIGLNGINKSNYIKSLIGKQPTYGAFTPFSKYVTQNAYADRYF